MHSMLASRSLLRGRDRGRRPAGPRRRRPPCRPRLLFAPLGVLELRRQHLEHHLHVLVSTGLHVFMKLQYAASTACTHERTHGLVSDKGFVTVMDFAPHFVSGEKSRNYAGFFYTLQICGEMKDM